MNYHPISNSVLIMDIPQMKTQHILKKKAQMDIYPLENSQEKKKSTIYGKIHSKKTISLTMQKLKPISALQVKFYIEEELMNMKTNKK